MDESSSQGLRDYSRNNRIIQPKSEWRCRKGKSNDYEEDQGYHRRNKVRQKAMNENRGYDRVSQESQSKKCSRNYILRALARCQTQSLASQNYQKHDIRSYSKGKAYETRYSFA